MDFEDIIKEDKEKIDIRLSHKLSSAVESADDESVKKVYRHLSSYILSGGKRLRAIALLLAYRACGGTDENIALDAACAVELVHNSTLVHDDIMDEDEARRNKPTVFARLSKDYKAIDNKESYPSLLFSGKGSRYSVSLAIIAGNIALSIANTLITDIKAQKKLYDAYRIVNDGQIEDITAEKKDITVEQYLSIARKKTAELFSAAIEIGAILAKAGGDTIDSLRDFQISSAIAFQVQDDIMDLSEDMQKGHALGSDIIQEKRTLPVIYALLDPATSSELKNILKKERKSEDDIKMAIQLIKDSGAFERSDHLLKKLLIEARASLNRSGISEQGIKSLLGLAEYFINRKI